MENNDPSSNMLCSMAKHESSKISWEIVNKMVPLLTMNEGLLENEFHWAYGDLRAHLIAGGSNEILKLSIFREISD